jgi:hypothetical protein
MRFNKDNAGEFGKKSSRKGISNKTNLKTKEFILKVVTDNLQNIQQDFKELEAKDRIKLTTDLMAYVIPKLRQVDATIESSNTDNSELIQRLLKIDDATFNRLENE